VEPFLLGLIIALSCIWKMTSSFKSEDFDMVSRCFRFDCNLRGDQAESITHVFRQCNFVRPICDLLNII